MNNPASQTTSDEEYDVIVPAHNLDKSLVELVTKADIDTQISTAKAYPRSIKQFLTDATDMVTVNEEVAASCNYGLPRGGKVIEGASARFAEIILSAWGNCRAGARVVHEDSRFVTAQGVCHDLQTNTIITMEVKRRITDKNGKTFKDDMVGVTGNAAASIALRNAILRKIPKAFWEPIYEKSREVALGKSKPMANRRADAMAIMQKFGVTPEMIFAKFEIKGVEDLTNDHLSQLNAAKTSIKNGDFTAEEIFSLPVKASESKGNESVKDKLRKKADAAGADPDTGEIKSGSKESEKTDMPNPETEQPEPKLETVDDVKQAASVLIIALEAAPKAVRSQLMAQMYGSLIIDAIRKHGQGVYIGKLKALGIHVDENESTSSTA